MVAIEVGSLFMLFDGRIVFDEVCRDLRVWVVTLLGVNG